MTATFGNQTFIYLPGRFGDDALAAAIETVRNVRLFRQGRPGQAAGHRQHHPEPGGGQQDDLKAVAVCDATFTRVNHADSANPVDQAKGWITEVDIVTWIMVGQMDDKGKLAHIYWYPCHIFVDDAMALINGRELFGYPKYLCEYEIRPPASNAALLRGRQGLPPFSPDTKIAMHPLLEVNATVHDGRA
jgi:hypothetical protein